MDWTDWLTPGQRATFRELTDRYDRDPRVMRKVVDRLADDLGLDDDEDSIAERLHPDAEGWAEC